MPFNAIRENRILAKMSDFTVTLRGRSTRTETKKQDTLTCKNLQL